jgi:hypothetical protein
MHQLPESAFTSMSGQFVVDLYTKADPSIDAIHAMKQRIDSAEARRRYSQRIGTVEPVFSNLRHDKRLTRFTLRGLRKVGIQWKLFCLVHNIEKLARCELQ